MKYCVIANLIVDTPTKNDKLAKDILDRIVDKMTWGLTSVQKGRSEKNEPQTSVEVRFDYRSGMEELYSFIKERIEKIPVLSGSVSKHECHHDTDNRPCSIEEEYSK